MTFQEIEKGVWVGRRAVTDRVAIRGNRNSSIQIGISRDIYKKMGEPAFVKLMRGSGEHLGMVLLRGVAMKASSNAYRVTTNHERGQAVVSVAPSRLGIKAPATMTTVTHHSTDEGLVLDLREFLR